MSLQWCLIEWLMNNACNIFKMERYCVVFLYIKLFQVKWVYFNGFCKNDQTSGIVLTHAVFYLFFSIFNELSNMFVFIYIELQHCVCHFQDQHLIQIPYPTLPPNSLYLSMIYLFDLIHFKGFSTFCIPKDNTSKENGLWSDLISDFVSFHLSAGNLIVCWFMTLD